MKQKSGCCGVFTSQLANLVLTICKSGTKSEHKGNVQILDIYGQPGIDDIFTEEYNKCEGIKPAASKSMADMPDEPTPDPTPVNNGGTLTIPAADNGVTTVTDGQIVKSDGTITVTEDVAKMSTTVDKPGETVNVQTNADGTVNETIVDKNGDKKEDKLNAAKDPAAPGGDPNAPAPNNPSDNAGGGGGPPGAGGGGGGAPGANAPAGGGAAASNSSTANSSASASNKPAASPVAQGSAASKSSKSNNNTPAVDSIKDQPLPKKKGSAASKKSEANNTQDSNVSKSSGSNPGSSNSPKSRPVLESVDGLPPGVKKVDIG